jgi:GNAT superfamily N-acetyltransferase
MGKITAPESLTPQHDISGFGCGVPSLDEWLRKQALKNEVSGASRTFVVSGNMTVVGFYALATGSVSRREAPGRISRKMPDPIPVVVLGRLAVDLNWQGRGIGPCLLKDAVTRALSVSQEVGVRALLVHALNENTKSFYVQFGFLESSIDPMTLMLGLSTSAS